MLLEIIFGVHWRTSVIVHFKTEEICVWYVYDRLGS